MAAEAPEAAKKDAAKPTATNSEETLLFTVQAGKHWVLGRTDTNGTCKGYLGPDGVSWLSYPDPEFPGDDLAAVTSSDGRFMALLSTRGGAANLWLLDNVAGKLEALTDDHGGIIAPAMVNGQSMAFSPDGKYLAFIQRGEATLMKLATKAQQSLALGGGVRALAWSPDGNWLAVIQGHSLRKIARSGTPNILLASDQCDSPSLAFVGNDEVLFAGQGLRSVKGQAPSVLVVASRAVPNMVAPVGNGKDVAFFQTTGVGRQEIFIATTGGKSAQLTQVTQGGADGVWASSNGKQLYFQRQGQLWRCETSGLKAKRLSAVRTGFVGLGSLAPLKGVCL